MQLFLKRQRFVSPFARIKCHFTFRSERKDIFFFKCYFTKDHDARRTVTTNKVSQHRSALANRDLRNRDCGSVNYASKVRS